MDRDSWSPVPHHYIHVQNVLKDEILFAFEQSLNYHPSLSQKVMAFGTV